MLDGGYTTEHLPPRNGGAHTLANRKDQQPVRIEARPFILRDPRLIPPRRWVYDRHYIRRFLSATFAPGGMGKSSLQLVGALAMVTGRSLLGVKPAGKLRVWYWNGEDPLEEIERRVAAICIHYEITAADIDGRLFINSGRETEIVLAKETRTGTIIVEPVAEALIATIQANRIDVVMIDPFVACHNVSENDNTRINVVARRWGKIADVTDIAMDLSHHVRKAGLGQSAITVEDGRGAGSLKDAVRSARVLNVMSKEEAEKWSIEQRRLYFRVDNGKANLAPPPEIADWRRLVSVDLGNATQDQPSDHVGVVTPWSPPNLFDGITVEDLRAVQRRIAKGEWRADSQSNEWVGNVVAEVLELDVDEPSVKAKIKELLKVWTKNGVLKTVRREDKHRKERTFVEVGEWATN